jgi:protein involved in polysaccharide export with SLBB domain
MSFYRVKKSFRDAHLAPVLALSALLSVEVGCTSAVSSGNTETAAARMNEAAARGGGGTMVLQPGDVIKISLPGTAGMDTTQTIRRDGKLSLALVGEVQAAGSTPSQLQETLHKLYAPQLVSSEVLVTIVASNFTAFVSGAVLRPGKISSDRPLTVLQAVMEAGGFDYAKANLKEVAVIRQDDSGHTRRFTFNLKDVLEGKQSEPFYLHTSDVVFVPERFALF